MILYRLLKKTDPIEIDPVKDENALINLVYSNEMPSHTLKTDRVVWSFAKTPEDALKWMGARGKGEYDRLAWYDFEPDDGIILDLTKLTTWVGLMAQSKEFPKIKNINYKGGPTIDGIRAIIPCSRAARSMAREAQEVVVIPKKKITLDIVENNDPALAPLNPCDAVNIVEEYPFTDEHINTLLEQLKGYDVRSTLKKELEDLKKELEDLKEELGYEELGYESEEEFLEDFLGCDENLTLDEFFDSYDPD